MYTPNLSSAPGNAGATGAMWALAVIVAIMALALFMPAIARAHGVVGNRIFLSPIVGNDAFPDNALDLSVRRSDYAFSLLPALEKQLSDNSSILTEAGWNRLTPGSRKRGTSGWSDLTIFFRQAIYISVPHELEFTVSPILVVPIGSRQIADQGYTHLGGEALVGKGMGDIPDSPTIKYLRPFAVQAEVGYAGRVQGPANSDDFANLEVEYSLRYLDRFVERTGIREPLVDLVPYLQFNYSQAFIASRLTTKPDFRLTPGIAYLGDTFEISIGPQIALNDAYQSGDRVAVLGLVEVFYDSIFPALGWNPF
jgi:hypothetical protein